MSRSVRKSGDWVEPSGAVDIDMNDYLDHHWPLDDGEGDATDRIGDRDIELDGPEWDGDFLRFSEEDDVGLIDNSDGRFVGLDSLSYFGWVYPTEQTDDEMGLFSIYVTDGNNRAWSARVDDGEPSLRVSHNGSSFESSEALTGSVRYDQWQSVAFVWDGENTNTYVNGRHISTTSSATELYDAEVDDLMVGDEQWSERPFIGRMSHQGLNITEPLGENEVLDLHNATYQEVVL